MLISPTFTIFTILTELRRGTPPNKIWQVFQRLGARLVPRLPFWLHICQEAGLLNRSAHPTSHVRTWLTLPAHVQASRLLEAWQRLPRNKKDRIARQALLRRLKESAPLKPRDQRELPGLQALGILQKGKLTAWGRVILLGEPAPTPAPAKPWYIKSNHLVITFSPDWLPLWDLEKYLRPASPGRYPLQTADLRRAAQRGVAGNGPEDWEQDLIRIIESGLKVPIPAGLRAAILGQPAIQVSEGVILEFSNPAELPHLRRSTLMRKHFERILSQRHASIRSQDAPRLLRLLEGRGLYACYHEESRGDGQFPDRRTHFYRSPGSIPMKNGQTVPGLLDEYLRLQMALDILYHAPGCARPEPRRITPLLVEKRGEQVYVTAYCHTRRAQRTFRLDRIEVPGEKQTNHQGHEESQRNT